MPLKLVTGPANAAKAGAVLGALRARVDEEPLLVVPAFEDVEHNQRELAARGAVFGVHVVRFKRLFGQIAWRAGVRGRPISRLQRELIVAEAVRGARLAVLGESAQRPGFVRAATRFVAELERSLADRGAAGPALVEPARLTQALRAWAGDGPRRAYVDEVAEIYRRYRERLDSAGLVDDELLAWQAVSALREDPARWGATPVFVYGFDDFTPLELAALAALAQTVDVTVSLPWEPGREAFRATATTHAELSALASEEVELLALDDHYDDGSRAALHALERRLFEDGDGRRVAFGSTSSESDPASPVDRGEASDAADPGETVDPGTAVAVHLAGGRRAEVELCAAEVLALLRDGTAPGDVAVVLRDPRPYASTIEQVFGAYGIPYSIDRRLPLPHTGVGRGLLALLRCAAGSASADDLLAYLRTPGRLRESIYADRLEVAVRRAGASTAAEARALWEGAPAEREVAAEIGPQGHARAKGDAHGSGIGPFPLDEIDRLAAAAADPERLLDELAKQANRLFSGPYRRTAHVLEGAELDDARAFQAIGSALRDLRALARTGSRTDLGRVEETLAALEIHAGEDPQPGRVAVATPLAIRARRYDAVFVCGLQEGEFPASGGADPFFSDADRREIAKASGLALPLREDQLERERYLFYVSASRAQRRLVLSARVSGEEGEAEQPSFFLDDVERVFPGLRAQARRRSLADVTWTAADAPTASEWDRAVAATRRAAPPEPVGPLALDAALAALRDRGAVSPTAVERFAGCPVNWLVEDVLKPVALEPDPERLVQGAFAHDVLELTYRRLRERTGDRRVTEANLGSAESIMLLALAEEVDRRGAAMRGPRMRAAVRRLEFQLLRHLEYESRSTSEFDPEHLELAFGLPDAEYPEVELEGGLRVRGKIDRVDRRGNQVAVRDYKSGRVGDYSAANWERKGRLQAALYMLVAERLLGVEAVAGLYTPLSGDDRRPRGALSAEHAEQLGGDFYATDVLGDEEFAELREWARGAIATAAAEMGEGRLCSKPDSCAYRGGCSHPSICRIER
jgi:RecB family exonuclease